MYRLLLSSAGRQAGDTVPCRVMAFLRSDSTARRPECVSRVGAIDAKVATRSGPARAVQRSRQRAPDPVVPAAAGPVQSRSDAGCRSLAPSWLKPQTVATLERRLNLDQWLPEHGRTSVHE